MTIPEPDSASIAAIAAESLACPPGSPSIRESVRTSVVRGRLRLWGTLSALSLLDQALSSGASFSANLLLARWMPANVYGAFAVAFAAFLFVAGFHNVLILEPMSVFGPARYSDKLPAYLASQVVIHAVFVGPLAVAVLLAAAVLARISPATPLIEAVAGVGLAVPLLLLQWLARRMCYLVQRPSVAAAGDAVYLAFVVAGLFWLARVDWLGSFSAFLLMGAGSALTGAVVFWRLGLFRPAVFGDALSSWRSVLRENWDYGRWLVGSTVLFNAATQAQMFLVAALLGLEAAGILRAMQIPSLAAIQVTTAAGLLVLPALSYDFGKGLFDRLRLKANLVSLVLVAGTLCFAALMWVFTKPVERLLFGGKYAAYAWLMPVLALIPVCAGFAVGYSMALRAFQKPQFDLLANGVAAPVGVVSAACFIHWWGLPGAAASLVITFFVSGLVNLLSFRRYPLGAAPDGAAGGVAA